MSQVVRRCAAILRSLESHPAGLSVGAIASDVGLPRSTVYRLLKSLEAEHLIASSSEQGGFRLGPALIHLSTSASAWLVDATHDHLVDLSNQIEETVDLAVLAGAQVHFVDHISGPHPLQAASEIGLAFPLHCTANGKALLADMKNAQVEILMKDRLEALTPNTITDMRTLLDELETVRSSGIAFDREEHNVGISAVGVKLDNPYGLSVAVSIPVPTSRFMDRKDEVIIALTAGHKLIEASIANSAPIADE